MSALKRMRVQKTTSILQKCHVRLYVLWIYSCGMKVANVGKYQVEHNHVCTCVSKILF